MHVTSEKTHLIIFQYIFDDHDHLTGQFRGTAHDNLIYSIKILDLYQSFSQSRRLR